MNREKIKIYDNIVITDKGVLEGMVSVQKMLDSLAAVQVEMAKGANPLSGLPGNVSIEQEIERRANMGAPFSIIYVDLDNFKAYNDIYGFKKGDGIILLASRILSWAVKRHGTQGDFLGHVGGDDFVIVTSPEKAERISKGVTRCFERLVKQHYSDEDRERGYIYAKDRHGVFRNFPLVAASLAIVDCHGFCELGAIAQRSAEMKKVAKAIEGNSFVRDRRKPLGIPMDNLSCNQNGQDVDCHDATGTSKEEDDELAALSRAFLAKPPVDTSASEA